MNGLYRGKQLSEDSTLMQESRSQWSASREAAVDSDD